MLKKHACCKPAICLDLGQYFAYLILVHWQLVISIYWKLVLLKYRPFGNPNLFSEETCLFIKSSCQKISLERKLVRGDNGGLKKLPKAQMAAQTSSLPLS